MIKILNVRMFKNYNRRQIYYEDICTTRMY